MNRIIQVLGWLLICHAARGAPIVTVGSWTPIFKGIELASGQQQATTNTEANHQVLCLRVDLTDPDIVLFTTPHTTNSTLETVSENTSHFLEQYGVQAAINGSFYTSSSGSSDSPLGTPEYVFGLAISRGIVVSPADDPAHAATLMFTTNNHAIYIPTNSPATNSTGMYTAISGSRPLLVRGTNVNAATPGDLDPRTAVGLSQDRRYLFLLTVDGRQSGWSDGTDFHDIGDWLLRFGAYDGINMDGGGSTTMAKADCVGGAVRLNRSSYVYERGRERNVGQNIGVYALPLLTPIEDISVQPGTTTAILTWHTDFPATTQVEYGLTTNYGNTTLLDSRPIRAHVATLNGLTSGTNYYFRARSSDGMTLHTLACSFATTSSIARTLVFGMTNAWKYSTNNLDGVNWKTLNYADSGWSGPSNACLHIETGSGSFPPRTTLLPPGYSPPFRTYYFRTHFNFNGSPGSLSLTFSNYLDDGAVFYLNGVEFKRIRMGTTNITYGSLASGRPSSGDATIDYPDIFTVSGNVLTNLHQGDNVVAVEVHNQLPTSTDILFGSALFVNLPVSSIPMMFISSESGLSTLFWNGQGFTLQQASTLTGSGNWSDVPGPVTQSPFAVTNQATTFYRLRQ